MRQVPLVLIPVLVLFLLLPSCRGSAPVIDELDWRVVYRDDGRSRHEELLMFLRFTEPDGPSDLAGMTVTAESEDLVWRLPASEWVTVSEGGAQWNGMPGMAPLVGFRLPDGLYTVRLEDLAGNADELSFRPDPDRPEEDGIRWPEAAIRDGRLVLTGPHPSGWIILRDAAGVPIERIGVSDGSAVNLSGASDWELWIDPPDIPGAFLLGPYPVSPAAAEQRSDSLPDPVG